MEPKEILELRSITLGFRWLVFISCFAISACVPASFEKAMEVYSQGKFEEAREAFEVMAAEPLGLHLVDHHTLTYIQGNYDQDRLSNHIAVLKLRELVLECT